MGSVASEYADYTIFTSEDPKCEDPVSIVKHMTLMLDQNTDNYEIILNRKDALAHALKIANKDDIVLVTGKGRETFYKENNNVYEYSDYDYLLDIKLK